MAHLVCKTDRAENGVVRHGIQIPKELVRRGDMAMPVSWQTAAECCRDGGRRVMPCSRTGIGIEELKRVFLFLFLGEAMD
jgi:hypothetical protein